MANGNATREFYNFSDQIRLQTTSLSSLSLGDNNIWSDTYLRKPEDRRNGAPDLPNTASWFGGGQKLAFGTTTTFDRYNYNSNSNNSISTTTKPGSNYFNNGTNNYKSGGGEIKNYFNKAVGKQIGDTPRNKVNSSEGKGIGKKKNNSNNNDNNGGSSAVDKRFKTLPPSEALPRSEAVGGYIFVCNNDTMQENLKRQLFGLPPRYRDSVRAITPGLPLFLYNYSTHQLHGIFEASSFGGTNIDPLAWEDKKCPGESRFPAQVRVLTRKICEPLEEDSFRPILHHYDGPKFRLELSVPEALALLDIFSENNV